MSSLGGRRRERGKTLLSPGSGPRFIREPAIDRLTEDRLAGVLSLLRSAQPPGPEFAEREFAEREFAEPEFAEPEFAEREFAEREFAEREFAESAQVISPPVDSVPELAARGHSLPELTARRALVPELAVPVAAVPAVAAVGRHRRPAHKRRSANRVPVGLRLVGLVVRRAAAIGLVTLVAITVGLGVLKAWG